MKKMILPIYKIYQQKLIDLNSCDFGDLIFARYSAEGVASPTRACFAGGAGLPSYGYVNNIEYVHFPTKGNSIDFGNLTDGRNYLSGATNGHGGL